MSAGHTEKEYHHICYHLYSNMCAPMIQNNVALLHLIGPLSICMRFFLVCEHICSPGSNANYESVSAEQPDSIEGQPLAKLVDVTPPPH